MYTIFLVEDDQALCANLSQQLGSWGFNVQICKAFDKVIEEMKSIDVDLVILDINLPFFDGFYWCKQIRELTKIPVIMLSARDSTMDQVMAMNIGADDYITKPFDPGVLIAKLNAILRRTYSYRDDQLNYLVCNNLKLSLSSHSLIYKDQTIELTKNEFFLLKLLFEKQGQIVQRFELMESLWNDDMFIDDNTLTVNVNRLRSKLNDYQLGEIVATKKGVGYYLKDA